MVWILVCVLARTIKHHHKRVSVCDSRLHVNDCEHILLDPLRNWQKSNPRITAQDTCTFT